MGIQFKTGGGSGSAPAATTSGRLQFKSAEERKKAVPSPIAAARDRQSAAAAATQYFRSDVAGRRIGASSILDRSGKPYLTYEDPNHRRSVLDTSRVATTFDPRTRQPLTAEQTTTPRIATKESEAIRAARGATQAQQLDHTIPISLAGSNNERNLNLVTEGSDGRQPLVDLEADLARKVKAGTISITEAQKQLNREKARAYGVPVDEGIPNRSYAVPGMQFKATSKPTLTSPNRSIMPVSTPTAAVTPSGRPSYLAPAPTDGKPGTIFNRKNLSDLAAGAWNIAGRINEKLYGTAKSALSDVVNHPERLASALVRNEYDWQKVDQNAVAKELGQGIAAGAAKIVYSGALALSQIPGAKFVLGDVKKQLGNQAMNKKLFGQEIIPYQESAPKFADALEKRGANPLEKGIGILGFTAGSVFLDEPGISGFAKGIGKTLEKGFVKELAEQTEEATVIRMLRSTAPELPEEAIEHLAPQLAAAKTSDEVAQILIKENNTLAGMTQRLEEAKRAAADSVPERGASRIESPANVITDEPMDFEVRATAPEASGPRAFEMGEKDGFATTLTRAINENKADLPRRGEVIRIKQNPANIARGEAAFTDATIKDLRSSNPASPYYRARTKDEAKLPMGNMELTVEIPYPKGGSRIERVNVYESQLDKSVFNGPAAAPEAAQAAVRPLQATVDASGFPESPQQLGTAARKSPTLEEFKAQLSPASPLLKDEKALKTIYDQAHGRNIAWREGSESVSREQRIRAAAEEGIRNATDAESYKQKMTRFFNERFERAPGKPGESFWQTLKRTVSPAKALDKESKTAFETWNKHMIAARELANDEAAAVGSLVPTGQSGVNQILNYERGIKTEYSEQIREGFSRLFREANARGLRTEFRPNYLPQVYANPWKEVRGAMARYLETMGVDKEVIKDYIQGTADLPEAVSRRLRLNPSFTKERVFPSYAVAMEHGLRPKYENPAQLLAYYREQMEKSIANRNFLERLKETGKLLPAEIAPSGFVNVSTEFSPQRLAGEPKVAKLINGLFRDENNLNIAQKGVGGFNWLSKKTQELALSGGVPRTTFNIFATGQMIRDMTAFDFKSAIDWARSSIPFKRTEWVIDTFKDNKKFIDMMTQEGLDLSGRVGQYTDLYENVLKSDSPLGRRIADATGVQFEKAFNQPTFGMFMPMREIDTFKQAYKRGLKSMSEDEARKFAAEVTRNFYGIVENVGRSKTAEEAIGAAFFAPKFREGLIRSLANTAKSVTTEWRNPAFYKNRRLAAGMAISYGLYNVANKAMGGNYMWENPPGHEFDLRVERDNGEVVYIPWMPSTTAFARNMISGAYGAARGDFKTAGQKAGSLLSMPFKTGMELISNRDYFGREIYDDADPGGTKLAKMAEYAGLTASHPWIREIYRQVKQIVSPPPIGKDPKPLHQSIAEALEVPVKFGSVSNESKSLMFEAQAKRQAEVKAAKAEFQPTYDEIQQLALTDENQAMAMVDALTDDEYKLYQSLKSSDTKRTNSAAATKMVPTVRAVQDLIAAGNEAEARRIVDQLTDEQYKAYQSAKKTMGIE